MLLSGFIIPETYSSALVQTTCCQKKWSLDNEHANEDAMQDFVDDIFITRAHHITQFILESLLPFDLDKNDGIYKENTIGPPECFQMVAAIMKGMRTGPGT